MDLASSRSGRLFTCQRTHKRACASCETPASALRVCIVLFNPRLRHNVSPRPSPRRGSRIISRVTALSTPCREKSVSKTYRTFTANSQPLRAGTAVSASSANVLQSFPSSAVKGASRGSSGSKECASWTLLTALASLMPPLQHSGGRGCRK